MNQVWDLNAKETFQWFPNISDGWLPGPPWAIDRGSPFAELSYSDRTEGFSAKGKTPNSTTPTPDVMALMSLHHLNYLLKAAPIPQSSERCFQ